MWKQKMAKKKPAPKPDHNQMTAGKTVIGHPFAPRDPPLAHQCKFCGWPKGNHP